jgi:multimeric flavodoxin WrbA
MKIVSIVSSYRQNGNTERLVKLLENSLTKTAEEQNVTVQIEHISLSKADIQLCCGCRACFDRGERYCPRKDDILKIRDTIMSADGIFLASPVYVEDINGLMKCWIDRMAFNSHRPAFYGKCAVILTTSGIGSSNHSLRTMKNALNSWGFTVESQSKYRMGARMETEKMQAIYGDRIRNIAGKLFRAINSNKANPPTLYSLVAFKVQQKYYQKTAKTATIDYTYWKDNGWLAVHTNYYYGLHMSNGVKTAFARIIGSIVSLFFI